MAGRGGKPGESRLDLLRDTARIGTEIGHTQARFAGTVVVATKPVYVLTQVMTQASGLPPERVLGTGTLLDTSRLRQTLGPTLNLAINPIHAQAVGENGDSEVVLWSGAHVGGVPLRDWPGWVAADEPRIALQVRRAAYDVIARKGATHHVSGLVTANLLRSRLRGERRMLTVSRVQQGSLGLHGVALSLPTVVGRGGGVQVVEPAMDEAERAALAALAQVVRQAVASLRSAGQVGSADGQNPQPAG